MPGNQELFAPVFIGLQLDFMLKKVTTQLPYSFPFRGCGLRLRVRPCGLGQAKELSPLATST